MNKNKKFDENLIVRQPKHILWMGIILTLLNIGIFAYMALALDDLTPVAFGIFLLITLANASLILTAITWQVTFEENSIHFRNQLGRTKTIPFESIGKVKRRGQPTNQGINLQLVLYSKDGRKFFSITSDFIGFDRFLKKLEQESIKFE